MTKPADTRTSPRRALGLVRVSNERDEMISPELQRTAITDHCDRRGFKLVGWREGIDESGSARRSRWWAKLDEAVAAVEAGDADVLVVWRFSRAARQRLRWAVAIDRVEVAGGAVESATEPLDTSTASGRLARGMLAEMAAYEAEVIGNTWREVHARRTARGLPANGKPRFGYRVVDGLHRPDPDTAPVLAQLYQRYIAGESMFALAAWLNTEGVTTVPGYSKTGPGPWSLNGLRKMLDTGFAAGQITVHGSRQRGLHEPVIDAATWEAYQAARAARRPLRRSERSPHLLSGMVWCGCGSKMGYGVHGRAQRVRLRCYRSTAPGAERHPANYVYAEAVEDAVIAQLAAAGYDVDALAAAAVRDAAAGARRRRVADAGQLERGISDIDKATVRLTVEVAKGLVPEMAYRLALDELTQERVQLEQRLADARAAADRPDGEPLTTVEHRRAAIKQLVDRVVVDGRKITPAHVSVHLRDSTTLARNQ